MMEAEPTPVLPISVSQTIQRLGHAGIDRHRLELSESLGDYRIDLQGLQIGEHLCCRRDRACQLKSLSERHFTREPGRGRLSHIQGKLRGRQVGDFKLKFAQQP